MKRRRETVQACYEAVGGRCADQHMRLILEATGMSTPRTTLQRDVYQVLSRYETCIVRVPMTRSQNIEGGSRQFLLFNPHLLLQVLANENKALADLLLASTGGGKEMLRMILYHDECSAGNVVAPDPALKACLMYFGFHNFKHHLRREAAWFPLGLALHSDISNWGGMSVVMKEIMKTLQACKLTEGLPMKLNGCDYLLRMEVYAFIGDYEAVRQCFDSKGSAGIRPCHRCINIISKAAKETCRNPQFLSITHPCSSDLVAASDASIFQVIDDMCGTEWTVKAHLEEHEKCCGFKLNKNGLLASPQRELLPPSKVLGDPMHAYWSKGLCSYEATSLATRLSKVLGVSLKSLRAACSTMPWRTSSTCRPGKTLVNRILHDTRFAADGYRGSAKDLQVAVRLMQWFLQEILEPQGDRRLQSELDSFAALHQVALHLSFLARQKAMTEQHLEQLNSLQAKHQELLLGLV